jgi:hypothetical protein
MVALEAMHKLLLCAQSVDYLGGFSFRHEVFFQCSVFMGSVQ